MSENCTGSTANWCPNCGDCKCPLNEYDERTLDDFNCPLHSYKSSHAEEEIENMQHITFNVLEMDKAFKSIEKSSLDQEPPPFDCWQRLINRYNFANVFQTGLVRNLECGNLHELKKLMIECRKLGIERYEVILQPFNGRSALEDLIEKQLDSLAYSEQVSIETPELTEEMLEWQRITINAIQRLIEFKSKQEKKEI